MRAGIFLITLGFALPVFCSESDPAPDWGEKEDAAQEARAITLREPFRKMVRFHVENVSLRKALGILREQGTPPIWVASGQNDRMVSAGSPQEAVTLEAALDVLTRAAGLAWTVRDCGILVGTAEELKEPLIFCSYSVKCFLQQKKPGPDDSVDMDSEALTPKYFVDWVQMYIDKAIWDQPGCGVLIEGTDLKVTAPRGTHRKIRAAFEAFFDACERPSPIPPAIPTEQVREAMKAMEKEGRSKDVGGDLEAEQYDIRDLITRNRDRERLGKAILRGEEIAAFLKERFEPAVWKAGNTIEYRNGRLFIAAPEDVQKLILAVLIRLRGVPDKP